ncbi:hypothetical protein D6817_05790 [Candidatus Pacearchaeota archaeon]|nr:MAG: hypothetical protein D6817_05790 [Candidatus Pacearchaeota archaeon]
MYEVMKLNLEDGYSLSESRFRAQREHLSYRSLVEKLASFALQRMDYEIVQFSPTHIVVKDRKPVLYMKLSTSEMRQLALDIENEVQEQLKRRMQQSVL